MEISLYHESSPATDTEVLNECQRLMISFPTVQREWIAVLVQMVIKQKMSKVQLVDAIDNILINFKYPHPTVSDVLSWEKKVKLYTHKEVTENIQHGYLFSDYDIVTINNEKRWIRK